MALLQRLLAPLIISPYKRVHLNTIINSSARLTSIQASGSQYHFQMLRNFLQRLDAAKQYISACLKKKDVFAEREEVVYSEEEVTRAIRFALASNATDYKNLGEIEHRLSAIIFYLASGVRNEGAEQLISLQQQAFWMTPKYVLYMFQKYLQGVMPTNITYYHFIREKEFYTQYVTIKYILVAGLHQPHHIFHKMKTNQKVYVFQLLLEWLLALVYYRCSAIYIASHCVDPLIFQANLLLSVLLGYGGNSILSSLTQPVINDVANKMIYIQGFLLSMAIPTKNYLSMEVIIITLRKLLTSAAQQKITMYLPSYLYANLIGYVKTPYTTHIIYRLLAYFLQKHKTSASSHSSSQAIEIDQFNRSHLYTQCWSLLALLADEYELDKAVSKELLLSTIESIQKKTINRAFVLRIANSQHLDLQEERIGEYVKRHKQPYVVGNKVVSPAVLAKNYHIVMEHQYYLPILSQAARGRFQKIDMTKLWEMMTFYNKFEIPSLDDYLAQVRKFERGDA